MLLKELLVDTEYILYKGDINTQVSGIYYDSRNVIPKSAFIAIKGFKNDGNDYIPEALLKGASVVILEALPEILSEGVTYIQVKNIRKVLSTISKNFYGDPSIDLKVVGVTGTNGKTSTSLILYHILNHCGKKAGFIGTLGHYYKNYHEDSDRTTPEAPVLHQLFMEMKKKQMNYAVMEVSSHSLSLHRVDDIHYCHGIFTNLSQDHLDFHKNMQEYFNTKKKLFYMTTGINVVNIDDEYGQELSNILINNGIQVITYGINRLCDVKASHIKYNDKGITFTYNGFGESITISCPMYGLYMVYNTMAAITIARFEGIPLSSISQAVNSFNSVPGRLEKVDIQMPYNVFIDFAHTPDGLEKVLKSLAEMNKGKSGKIITLFGCGGDRDTGKRSIMGKIAGELSDYCIITSDNPRSESPSLIINEILSGISQTNGEYIVIEDRYEAIKFALKFAGDSDLILLAGKGHETYQILKDKTIPFDEKEIIKEILENDTHRL